MPGRYYFVIVGRKDNPLYERNFESKQSKVYILIFSNT